MLLILKQLNNIVLINLILIKLVKVTLALV